MKQRKINILREICAGLLLLGCGVYVGYEYKSHQVEQLLQFLQENSVASDLKRNSVLLINLKGEQACYTSSFVQVSVEQGINRAKLILHDKSLSLALRKELNESVNYAMTALKFEDRSGQDITRRCTQ